MDPGLVQFSRDIGGPPLIERIEPFRAEILEARAMVPPVPWEHIVIWLRDIHGIDTSDATLRRKVKIWKAQG